MMMFFKLTLVCALVAASALAKSVPARDDAKELEKVAQKEELPKSSKLEQVRDTLELSSADQQQQQQQREELSQIKEEELPVQHKEEAAPIKGEQQWRYEAKPQVSRDELAKGQQREELPKSAPKGYEAQRASVEEQKWDQQQVQALQEQVEIRQQQEEASYVEQVPLSAGPTLIRPLQQVPIGEAEPYSFSYQIDGSSRRESGDTKGVVRGQYTLQGADGGSRLVEYIADANGFRASVNTNEFGTENKSPAGVAVRTSQPSAESISKSLELGKTREEAPRFTQVLYAETKGAAPLPAPILPLPLEKLEKVRPAAEEVPRKGYKAVQPELDLPQQQQQEWAPAELPARAEPLNSAPLRAPKAVVASKQLQRSVNFQSATAHRVVPQTTFVRPVAPVNLLRASPSFVRSPVPAVARVGYVSRDRYPPPSPVLVHGYRRSAGAAREAPRVSFYGSEDEPVGFLDA